MVIAPDLGCGINRFAILLLRKIAKSPHPNDLILGLIVTLTFS
jgi:hypothetical protein